MNGNLFFIFPLTFSSSKPRGFVKVNINGELVAETDTYTGFYQEQDRHEHNIVLINNKGQSHAAITDVNVWRRILSVQEIKEWQYCRTEPEGKVINWDTADLIMSAMNVSQLNGKETCLKTPAEKKYISFNIGRNFDETGRFCRNIGGAFAVARDEQSSEEISRTFGQTCQGRRMFFTGFKRMSEDSDWLDIITGETLRRHNWTEDTNKKDFDCIVQNVSSGELSNSYCSYIVNTTEIIALCPVCEFFNQPKKFNLRGVCEESSVESLFVIQSHTEFLGFLHTTMRYSESRARWELVNTANSSQVWAFMQNDTDFPIGVRKWYFLDADCTDSGEEFRTLSFHLEVSQPGHFCCNDGTCVDSERVCDDFSDCDDGTDERNCTFVHIPSQFLDTEKPPREYKNGKIQPIVLNATFHVLEIFEINDVDSMFDLHFILKIQWFQQTLRFEFLKKNEFDNFLYKTSKENIWTPTVEFSDVKEEISLSGLSRNENDDVIVLRKGEPQLDSDLQGKEVYSGKENPLKIFIARRKEFSCSFDKIKNFPFGKQKCSVMFHLTGAGATNRIDTVVQTEAAVVGQYVIVDWIVSQKINDKNGRNMTVVTMILTRNILNVFMVTYLPTILMNLINQATNYISGDTKYDMIYTINITCMMVLASVYLSVSASLPQTSDIKPVEIWLIFNLAFPFLVILVNVLLQVMGIIHR